MKITKQDFEKVMTVAGYANDEIYDKVVPFLDAAAVSCHVDYLGTVAGKVVEDNTNAMLADTVKRFIILDGFINAMPQLDLILTPTGFGVVSSDAIAPASKARVDSMRNSVKSDLLRTRGTMLYLLRDVEGWGKTEQARRQIKSTLFCINQVDDFFARKIDVKEWDAVVKAAHEIYTELSGKYNSKQLEDILSHVRHAVSNAKDTVMADAAKGINTIIIMHAWHSVTELDAKRDFFDFVEDNLDVFSTYAASTQYKANHYQGYENRKEDTAFICKG